jgi:hypothetical protein
MLALINAGIIETLSLSIGKTSGHLLEDRPMPFVIADCCDLG